MGIIRVPFSPNRYKGQLDPMLVAYLLRKYFKPGDLIIDPMAGGRTVEDVAKSLDMKCLSNDILDRDGWDAREPWRLPVWVTPCPGSFVTRVDGVILHPPYFRAKKYSDDSRDIGNIIDYEEYLNTITCVMAHAKRAVKPDGCIILVIGDYRKENRLRLTHSYLYTRIERELDLALENMDLWELTATGTPLLGTKHMMMFNWCMAFRRPALTLHETMERDTV